MSPKSLYRGGITDFDWFKEEISQCYYENLRDPAFKLIFIMNKSDETPLR